MILEIDFKLDVIRDMRCARLFHLAKRLLRAQIATQDAIEEHPTLLGPHKIAVRMNRTQGVVIGMRAVARQPMVAFATCVIVMQFTLSSTSSQ